MNSPTDSADLWAALDLGSNSFHLLLVRPAGHSFVVLERLKEKVQLLAGFRDSRIHPDALRRGTDCLERFAQRLRSVPREQVLVMGTHALRQAHNAADFVDAAQNILRTRVQVISGQQEARLIYQGVTHHVAHQTGARLVIDIGGGSTELAWGTGAQSSAEISVAMGCVAFTEQYINPAAVPSAGFLLAKEAAVHALKEGIEADGTPDELRREPQLVVGTSGTIESVQTVLAANGWPSDVITAEAIDDLGQSIAADRWVIDAGLPGLAPDRMDIFAAGVAILSACFEVLQIQTLRFAPVSMLQGMIGAAVVDDLTQDLCEDSVERLAERYGVDRPQALRVMDSATELFAKSAAWWEPDDLPLRQLLRWAARLHEVGVVVSSSHYHRHGGYIIKHSQMPGFTHPQQNILALLVRGHRRSMPGLAFRAFDPDLADKLLRLVALLRIAVILQRSHCDGDAPTSLSLTANQNTLHLRCGADWLATHPLSHKELQVEAGQLHRVGLNLVFGD